MNHIKAVETDVWKHHHIAINHKSNNSRRSPLPLPIADDPLLGNVLLPAGHPQTWKTQVLDTANNGLHQ
jgi:hypothetical protein